MSGNRRILSAKKLYSLLTQHIASKIIALACEYRFDELLDENPILITEFSNILGFNHQATLRLLKVLDFYEIVQLVDSKMVKKGKICEVLNTVRGPHLLNGFLVMNNLEVSLKRNSECYSTIFGEKFSDHIQQNTQLCNYLQNWSQATLDCWFFSSIINSYDFSKFTSFCEMGGDGYFLIKLLQNYPHATGFLVNNKANLDRTNKLYSSLSATTRIQYVHGDKLSYLSDISEVYVFCRALLNLSTEKIIEVLTPSNLIAKNGVIIIIDFYLPDKNHSDYLLTLLADINILTCLGGKLRSRQEWLKIIEYSHFSRYEFYELGKTEDSQTVLPMFLIEARF